MPHRNSNAAFLKMMIELHFRLKIIQAVLENDSAFATLVNTGYNSEALEDMGRTFAQPLLMELLEFFKNQFVIVSRPGSHEEHSTTISILVRTTHHAITIFADESQPVDLRRYAVSYNIGQCNALVGVAIRSEIGVMTDETASVKRMAANKAKT